MRDKLNPFDFVNSVTFGKNDLLKDDPDAIRGYVPFIVNKALSYHLDTLLDANEMNKNAHLESRMQYSFFLHSLRKARRFSKWAKPEESDELEAVQKFFRYNTNKAKQALALLTPEQLKRIMAVRGERNDGARKHG